MERVIFVLSIVSVVFCFFCALICFYLSDGETASRKRRASYLVCGVMLFLPIASIFLEGNIYLLVARAIIFLFLGVAIISDAIICRIAVRWTMAVEIFIGLIVLIPGVEIVIKFAILQFSS